jgi:hypothetical protein
MKLIPEPNQPQSNAIKEQGTTKSANVRQRIGTSQRLLHTPIKLRFNPPTSLKFNPTQLNELLQRVSQTNSTPTLAIQNKELLAINKFWWGEGIQQVAVNKNRGKDSQTNMSQCSLTPNQNSYQASSTSKKKL